MPDMDRAIWAIWYDLPERERTDHFDWLHGTHLPALAARPGYLWAASYEVIDAEATAGDEVYDPAIHGPGFAQEAENLGTGKQFIQLVGATNTRAFFDPATDTIPEITDATAQKVLARRQGIRAAMLVEEDRVDGPDVAARPVGTAPGPIVQLGAYRQTTTEAQFVLGAWYAQERMKAMGTAPGSICMRKFAVAAGWARLAPLYEFVSLDAREEFFKDSRTRVSEEHAKLMKFAMSHTMHAPGSPALAKRIWPE